MTRRSEQMLYRVRVRHYNDQGINCKQWGSSEVLYCGADLHEARRAYHESQPNDKYQGCGNPSWGTFFEQLDESDLADDDVGEMEEV